MALTYGKVLNKMFNIAYKKEYILINIFTFYMIENAHCNIRFNIFENNATKTFVKKYNNMHGVDLSPRLYAVKKKYNSMCDLDVSLTHKSPAKARIILNNFHDKHCILHDVIIDERYDVSMSWFGPEAKYTGFAREKDYTNFEFSAWDKLIYHHQTHDIFHMFVDNTSRVTKPKNRETGEYHEIPHYLSRNMVCNSKKELLGTEFLAKEISPNSI